MPSTAAQYKQLLQPRAASGANQFLCICTPGGGKVCPRAAEVRSPAFSGAARVVSGIRFMPRRLKAGRASLLKFLLAQN